MRGDRIASSPPAPPATAAPGRTYDSFAAFVAEGLGPSVTAETLALPGRMGARMYRLASDAPLRDPAVPELVVHLMTAGELSYAADFGFGRFEGIKRPGQFDCAPPGTEGLFEGEGTFALLSLSVPWGAVQQVAERAGCAAIGDLGGLHARMEDCSMVGHLLEGLWHEGAEDRPEAALFADSALSTLILRLLRLADAPRAPVPPTLVRGGLAPWQVRRVIEWIEADLAGEHSLETLAGLVDLSPFHFLRAFATSMGKPPRAWIVERRMTEAKRLLRETAGDTATIARRLGYASGGAFARAFRQHAGMTPRDYRRLR